jgi:hypothetical protein
MRNLIALILAVITFIFCLLVFTNDGMTPSETRISKICSKNPNINCIQLYNECIDLDYCDISLLNNN